MKSTCWDTCATDSIIKSGQKDTEASIQVCEVIYQKRAGVFDHDIKT